MADQTPSTQILDATRLAQVMLNVSAQSKELLQRLAEHPAIESPELTR